MARIVKGKQFDAVDYQGNCYDKFRMKEINGYWFAMVRKINGEQLCCTLNQIDSKGLGEIKEIK